MSLIWIGTEANTADFPTRDLPLPEVQPPPPWLARIYSRYGMPTPLSQKSPPPPLRRQPAAILGAVQSGVGAYPLRVSGQEERAAAPVEVNRGKLLSNDTCKKWDLQCCGMLAFR